LEAIKLPSAAEESLTIVSIAIASLQCYALHTRKQKSGFVSERERKLHSDGKRAHDRKSPTKQKAQKFKRWLMAGNALHVGYTNIFSLP
jgi:hypothetical protein